MNIFKKFKNYNRSTFEQNFLSNNKLYCNNVVLLYDKSFLYNNKDTIYLIVLQYNILLFYCSTIEYIVILLRKTNFYFRFLVRILLGITKRSCTVSYYTPNRTNIVLFVCFFTYYIRSFI